MSDASLYSQAEPLLMKAGVQLWTLAGVLLDLGSKSATWCSQKRFCPSEGPSLGQEDGYCERPGLIGTCVHLEKIQGGETCQSHKQLFNTEHSFTQLPEPTCFPALQWGFFLLCNLCMERSATTIYSHCYQDFLSSLHICEQGIWWMLHRAKNSSEVSEPQWPPCCHPLTY